MTTEVLVPSSFVETGDDGVTTTGYLQSTTTTQSWVALPRNAVILATKDQGVGSPLSSTAYIEGAFVVTAMTGATAQVIDFGFIDGLVGANATTESITLQLNDTNATTPYGISLRRRSATGNTNPAIYASAAVNTTYYYRLGFYSALSQYGTVIADIYSDSGRTTLVASVTEARLSNATYRYVALAQNVNSGSADSITGSISDSTLYHSLTGLDLTTFTETDAGADLTVYADCIVADTMAANVDSYVYKDGGVGGYAGNYILKGVVNVSALSGSGSAMGCLMLSNTVQGSNGTADLHAVIVNYASVGNYRIKLREYSGAVYDSTYAVATIALSTPTWIKVWRDTSVGTYGTLYLATYSDPGYSVQVGSTVSLTLHENIDFQYLVAASSYNAASANTITGTVGGITITNVSPITLTSDGAATATVVSASKASAALSSDGAATATVTAVNADTNSVILNSAGVSTADAVSASIASAAASSDGVATAEVVSNSFIVPVSSDGVATATAAASSIAAAAASSDGVATADTISSFTLNPGIVISCRITKRSAAGEVGATGLTPYLKFNNPLTRKSMDFGDPALTFKNNDDCISISAAMSPVDATNYAGLYYYSVDGAGLGTGAATRFDYFIDATISATETYMNEGTVIILDGVEVLPGLTAAEHTLLTRISAAVTNKHVLNPADGTIKVYDDNGALLYSAMAYSNAAGTTLYNGKSAVHHTSRLA